MHAELTTLAYAAINDVQDTLNHEHGEFPALDMRGP